ncbi:MAG: polysaccharide biosynthesis protein [Clostridia bacterium]|nr:polysaccharide biosynthesis protein [Clostridia bacterium]
MTQMKRLLRRIYALPIDLLLLELSLLLSLALRLDFGSEERMSVFCLPLVIAAALIPVLYCVLYFAFGMHRVIWQYANLRDVLRLCLLVSVVVMLTMGMQAMLNELPMAFPAWKLRPGLYRLPWGMYPICICVSAMALTVRYMVQRTVAKRMHKHKSTNREMQTGRMMIIGAGMAAHQLIRSLHEVSPKGDFEIICALDDDPGRMGAKINGVPVVGKVDAVAELAEKYDIDTIVFAIPSCPRARKAEILSMCTDTGCRVRTVPAVEELVDCRLRPEDVRNVHIEDLLEREPVCIDANSISEYLYDKTVLVTGGGGSIGSELCKQIAAHRPRCLIMLDICENNVYELQNELRATYPALNQVVLIGSVRDRARIRSIFARYRPEVIYHAAAHKHVPLMEDSPAEAVKNNIFGTLETVQAAHEYGAQRFVMISTDKAVNPTNVMGACKRVCERIIQYYNKISKTQFTAVRFGNVLGSNGSVVPLFKKQIEMGGPVTVTHPDIVRYFMTIPEAVSLVLQAGAMAEQGGILILDMGQPVRIRDMAYRLIRLSGYVPEKDIKVVYTGLRPGEKIFEELVDREETMLSGANSLIHVGKEADLPADFMDRLEGLRAAIADEDADVRALLCRIVPTYMPNGLPNDDRGEK